MRYNNLHTKVRKDWGKANKCEICKGKYGKRFEWSNRNHKYLFIRKDWWMLCSSCHRGWDAKIFGRTAWNKGKPIKTNNALEKFLRSHGAWNKGLRKRENIICICGREFYPPKPSSLFCSKHCAMIGNERSK